MPVSQSDVDAFLAADKTITAGTPMRWVTRNVHARRCHVRIEASGASIGELILLVNVAQRRHWTFSLLRRRIEVLRWDFTSPPYRHRNQPACGPNFPPTVRDLEHEHVWTAAAETRCVRGLAGLAQHDHRQALAAFCDRGNIDMLTAYQPPTAPRRAARALMATDTDIHHRLAEFLGSEVEVHAQGDRLAVMTPAEYPDGDGVVVWVAATRDGFEITDLGEGDARLAVDGPGPRAVGPAAATIARRFGTSFDGGVVVARVDASTVPEASWRVAQASAAIAEAATFHRAQAPKEAAFVDMLERELRGRQLEVQTDAELQGASGHRYTASIFVPSKEAVLEPVSGERAWNKAAAIYVEFGDLGRANGYQLLSVLDDREPAVGPDVEGLLGQVSVVARWSRRGEWIDAVTGGRLI